MKNIIRGRLFRKLQVFGLLVLLTLIGKSALHTSREENILSDLDNIQSQYVGRRTLESDRNCTPAAIEQFPRPLMDIKLRREGGIFLHVLVSFYMFLALAIVCDDYFVPSLEKICEVLDLKPDVAGATFMAAGSSAPELAAAVIAVFVAKDDIGLGAVIGSAVFNIMFVIGICALGAGMVVSLSTWPLIRDCSFYLLSIGALLIVMYDEEIMWYEAVGMLLLYIVYCIFMYFNSKFELWFKSLNCPFLHHEPVQERTHLVTYNKMDEGGFDTDAEKNGSSGIKTPEDSSAKLEDNESAFEMPHGARRQFMWFLSLPLNFICYITVPDCRKPRWRKWFIITFIMSLVWISIFSYVLVWMITIIGFTLAIPDTVMGLTFLAAGVSVPDAISSLLVVREGLGDMAVSNAIGSNVFDILICLGVPWFLQTVLIHPNSFVPVLSKGLTYSTISLLSTVLFLLVSIHLNKWKLSPQLGIVLLIWYLLFMVFASLYELNIFGDYNPPTCPSNY
uniref:Sodium/potassium/calcium exchanger n=1 Tax=Hemiscolopendra marginata TaxID=943146 RepID=A0A646QFR9_9MYRI